MNKHIALAFVGIAIAWPAGPALADSTDSALKLCQVMDGSGLDSSPCQVGAHTVTVVVDMEASEARKFCREGVVKLEASLGLTFDPGWQIFIRSPYSGDQSIAYCKLGV